MRVEEVVDRVVARFIGTKHERDIKRLAPTIAAMNALAPEYERADAMPTSRRSRRN